MRIHNRSIDRLRINRRIDGGKLKKYFKSLDSDVRPMWITSFTLGDLRNYSPCMSSAAEENRVTDMTRVVSDFQGQLRTQSVPIGSISYPTPFGETASLLHRFILSGIHHARCYRQVYGLALLQNWWILQTCFLLLYPDPKCNYQTIYIPWGKYVFFALVVPIQSCAIYCDKYVSSEELCFDPLLFSSLVA